MPILKYVPALSFVLPDYFNNAKQIKKTKKPILFIEDSSDAVTK